MWDFGTNLYTGLNESKNILEDNNYKKTIILISDGKHNEIINTGVSHQEVLDNANLLKDNNIIIYTIAIGNDANINFMQEIASENKAYSVNDTEDLETIFDDIKEDIDQLTAENIIIKDVLPQGVEYVSGPTNCNYNLDTKTVTCTIAPLTNESTSVDFNVLVTNYDLNYVNEYTEINYSMNSVDETIRFDRNEQPIVNVQNTIFAYDDNAEGNEDENLEIDVLANDFDYDDLFVINLDKNYCDGNIIMPQNGTIEISADNKIIYMPNENFFGTDYFQYAITDNNLIACAYIYVNILPVNDAPVLNTIGDLTLEANTDFNFEISATDIDSINLTFKIDDLNWINLIDNNNNTATIFGTSPDTNESYNISAHAYDDNNNSDYKTFNITVIKNYPPILNSIGNKSVSQNTNLSFNISASDIDSANLVFNITNLPIGANFIDNNDNTASFSWTPIDVGIYTITFSVSDEKSTTLEDVIITVNAVSTGGGGGGSSGGSSKSSTEETCATQISYSEWSECVDNKQTRTYEILNLCDDTVIELSERSCYSSTETIESDVNVPIIIDTNLDVNNEDEKLNAPVGLFTLGNGLFWGLIVLALLIIAYIAYKIIVARKNKKAAKKLKK